MALKFIRVVATAPAPKPKVVKVTKASIKAAKKLLDVTFGAILFEYRKADVSGTVSFRGWVSQHHPEIDPVAFEGWYFAGGKNLKAKGKGYGVEV
jgi:hypothetical protein